MVCGVVPESMGDFVVWSFSIPSTSCGGCTALMWMQKKGANLHRYEYAIIQTIHRVRQGPHVAEIRSAAIGLVRVNAGGLPPMILLSGQRSGACLSARI